MLDRQKHILCVDDEPDMLTLYRLILQHEGFKVSEATGGKEGIEKIQELQPDLVILDLMMPLVDGWEVYQQMKKEEKTRQIPVIVVTAKAQNIDKVLGLNIAKVDDYISKPFVPADLVLCVENILNHKKII